MVKSIKSYSLHVWGSTFNQTSSQRTFKLFTSLYSEERITGSYRTIGASLLAYIPMYTQIYSTINPYTQVFTGYKLSLLQRFLVYAYIHICIGINMKYAHICMYVHNHALTA